MFYIWCIIVQRIHKEMVLFLGLITKRGCNQRKMIKVKYFTSIVNQKAKVPLYEWVKNCFKLEMYGEQCFTS